jgi:hypothetical protein
VLAGSTCDLERGMWPGLSRPGDVEEAVAEVVEVVEEVDDAEVDVTVTVSALAAASPAAPVVGVLLIRVT